MKNWLAYISEHLKSDIWGFIALDYYHDQKVTLTEHSQPAQFIDMLLDKIPLDNVDAIDFHRVLLCISAQLLGNDFDEVMAKSLRFIELKKDAISKANILAMSSHYDAYKQADVFLEKVKSLGVNFTDTLPGESEEDNYMNTTSVPQPKVSREKRIHVFYSYAHEDERMRKKMEAHLSLLRKEGHIVGWHDREILPGKEFGKEIDKNLKKARLILLLVSSDFFKSDYCTSVEMTFALEQHQKKAAIVVPIILRNCDWKSAPFGKLLALPTDGKPIAGGFKTQDVGFTDVVRGLRRLIESL